ncbi:MAG TPA: M15 family metallopeptidase [Actinoplanes sp.]|nr:M15 family metallopeptidase [Actinoplanes sp.]
MTNRHQHRPERQLGTWIRACFAATVVAAALLTVGATTSAAPAQAAVPTVAQTWSSLMHRSLTVTATKQQLTRTLAAQRAVGRARLAALEQATAADATARRQLTTANLAHRAATARHLAARRAVSDARKARDTLRPRTKSALNRAQQAVTAAERTLHLRRTQNRQTAITLSAARSTAATAATSLSRATRAVASASATVQATIRKIGALPTPGELSSEAAKLSRSVVSSVRPRFTTADTTVVYGTTVHRNIAFAYKRMVDDAKKAGISISGGGFRTKQRQIELRKINGCPNVWKAPASSCRVPTAIPGRSLHEIGLAIDITSGGRSLNSRSPAFKWLKSNARKYGFVNLPSEPWHWSITGG